MKNLIIWDVRPPQSFGHVDLATPKIFPLLRPWHAVQWILLSQLFRTLDTGFVEKRGNFVYIFAFKGGTILKTSEAVP